VSKCDFATYIFAARALEALGVPLKGQLELHFTYDEEFGGLLGPGWLLEQKLTKPDYVIAAGFSYNIVTAHNACLQLEITVHGKSGHGAMPETGHDALQAANRILNAIYGQLPELKKIKSTVAGIDSPTMLVGRIDGGTNTNVVPGKVVLKMDRRMIPEEDPVEVEAQVRALIENAVQGVPGIRIEIRRLLLSHALRPSGHRASWWPACKECANHPRRKIPARHAAVCGCAPVWRAWHPGGAVWRRSAHGARIERQEGRRATGAGRLAQGQQDRRPDLARFSGAEIGQGALAYNGATTF
jgi:acetylornithine deacetylase/succinyl-diaminopimelate desuccinylase-like protein